MKHLLLLISLLISQSLMAKNEFPYWNNVSSADLKMTTYEADTTAAAVYLLNYGKARYDIYNDYGVFKYDYHYQIKILKKSAFNQSAIKFSFPKRYPLLNLKAVIHNWENGKKVSKEVTEFFDEKISKYNKGVSFAFPDVKVGSVIEYQFTQIYSNTFSPPKFYFQKKYPVKFVEFHFAFPSRSSYQTIPPNINITGKGNRTYVIQPPDYQSIQMTEYFWQAEGIKAVPYEPFVNNIDDYRQRLTVQLSSYLDIYTNKKKELISTWEELAKDYRDDNEAGKLYTKTKRIKKIIPKTDVLLATMTSEKEKTIALYHYVQSVMEWNESHRIYASDNFKSTIEQGYGNSADINLLLLALLKHYKIPANPVLISTQDNDRIVKNYPFIRQFNHVIIQAIVDNKPIYLDAINPDYPYNILPQNSIFTEGFMISDNTKSWVKPSVKKSESVTILNLVIQNDGIVTGDIKQQHKSYAAYNIRKKIDELGVEKYKSTIFNNAVSDIEITNFEQENLLKNIKKPVITTFDFTIKDAVQVNDDYLYLNPFLGLAQTENPFKDLVRNLPIDLPYPEQSQLIINIKIPDNYAIEELPENVAYKLLSDKGQFIFISKIAANNIQLVSKVGIYEQHFQTDSYNIIKEFNDIIVQNHNNQIILKKK